MSDAPNDRPARAYVAPPARKVAGARRNPNALGIDEQTAPRWLRSLAGVSWRLILVVIAIFFVFYAVWHVLLLFIALFLACVFTAVLRPLVEWLSKVMPRGLATGLGLLSGIAFFLGLLTYVGYSIIDQWDDLSKQFSTGITQITDFLESGKLPFTITNEQIVKWIDSGQQWLQDHAGELATQAAARAGSVVEIFTALALAIFCTVFFLARGKEMWTWFLNQLPARHRETWKIAGGAGWYTFSGYTRGTVIIALTDGALAFTLLLILGVPLAAPLAVLVFIGAFIPLVGAPTAMVVAMIVALAANGLWSAVAVGVGIALIGQFEGHILQPFIMGKQVSIHPVVIALAVTAGTLTGGLLGAVIAVPLVAVFWAIFSRLRTIDPPMSEDDADDDVEPDDDAPQIDDDEPVKAR
ncbi:AI-2E family transporter [Cellulomonas rhizosphaerae]|uniref:AI-2E family transporter n=1 Tax=Cellulomonas rhizosphaerae TaxID=2293719 RepID=A0A413RLN6_9CELL|nr:AI-2E family transporter [Cellulomonas rhizosphaerae]RHA41010.1 AI-2E family transporter [Cellulomonas rhizosphaerae]